MTAQYIVYRLTFGDGMVYVGSTKQPLNERVNGHKSDARCGNNKRLSQHIRQHGEGMVAQQIEQLECTRLFARTREQVAINDIPEHQRLNSMLAHQPIPAHRTENVKAKKRAQYARYKTNPAWLEKERQRNKARMRIKRAAAPEQQIQ